MNVKKIVEGYLISNNLDGLVCLDAQCGCLLENLAPCGRMSEKCRPGHREDIGADSPCECDQSGENHWHIVPDGVFGVIDEEEEKRWVCGPCSVVCDPWAPDWRWNGMEWEHYHGGSLGHVAATKKQPFPC